MEKYLALRNEIDLLSKNLEIKHAKHMKCKSGCDMCCMDYSVFPIEFYAILKQLQNKDLKPQINKNALEADCVFLNSNKCTIYEARPVICRTHGLPLMYMNDNGDWELSACELNFTEFDMESFSDENTFPQDTFNSKLFVLNQKFIKKFEEKKYNEFDLIPLRKLKEYL
jgi:Fe-S-cluster containining protein